MTLDEAIFLALSSAPAVVAIADDREYPVEAPQDTPLPFIVWQEVSASPLNTHDGPAELDEVTVQVTAYAATFTDAHDLRRAARAALEDITLGNGSRGIVTNTRQGRETESAVPVFSAGFDIEFLAAP